MFLVGSQADVKVFVECTLACVCVCVCSQSCSHTPGSFTLTATGNLTEGGRCPHIHQPSSKCSVWARCDGPEAGTELPKQLFIFPNVFIFSSSTLSPLVSTYNRGLAVPASPPFLPGVRIEMANRGERSGLWGSLKVSSLVWKWGRKWEQKMLEGADVKYSIDLLLSYFPHDIGSSTVSKRTSHRFWQLVVFLKFFQWCVSSFEEPKLPSSYTENKFHCSLVSCANEAQASLALSRQRGKGAFHVSLQAGVPPPPSPHSTEGRFGGRGWRGRTEKISWRGWSPGPCWPSAPCV